MLDDFLEELSAKHGTHADIAWHGDTAIGFTCWLRVFPAGDNFALYMKELYVAQGTRGLGVGRALMQFLANRAVDWGASSILWESNEPDALVFYERLGQTGNGKTSYTASGAALRSLIGGNGVN